MDATPGDQRPFSVLRRYVRRQAPHEQCALCSAALASEHQHLIEPTSRQLVCSCDACAILFSGDQSKRYRRVPRRIRFLPDFRMTDPQWEDLHVPINLAFFCHSSLAERVVAMYPSPAGATESLLTLEAWHELKRENPILDALEPDVEALRVNRSGPEHAYYIAPIDECYKLVGLIRVHWRGLSGGTEVWKEMGRFFTSLKEKAIPARRPSDA